MKRDHMMGFQQATEGANVDPLNWWCSNEFPLGVPKNRAIVGFNAGDPADIAACHAEAKACAFERGDHTPDYMKKPAPPKEYFVTLPSLGVLQPSDGWITISSGGSHANYEHHASFKGSISQMRRELEEARRELVALCATKLDIPHG